MLTDLSFLNIGQRWPPADEEDRLDLYDTNKRLFEGDHADVYEESFKRIERIIGNFNQVISYPVIINYQKKISLKVADLLFGEPPRINAGDEESAEQKTIDTIKENADLINTAYECSIDISRYGDGILNVYKDGNKGLIDVTPPSIWFPVVDMNNLKKIQFHVLAWEYKIESADKTEKRLKVQIHNKGFYDESEYRLAYDANKNVSNTVIQTLQSGPVRVKTGLDDFALIPIPNIITSDRVTGLDDYSEVDSIISELLVRVGQISRVLDKHASPSVTGPSTALEKDPVTGEWKLKMGNYFPRNDKDDPIVGYITWDGQLEASFKHIENLINMLYTISEMGSAIFGDVSQKSGQIPSGSALRRLMISPLAKVNRVRMRFDPALKKAIKLCSQLGGEGITDLSNVPISITWQDGLPGDPKEEADIMKIRTADKATMSQKRALMQFDGMANKEAEEELELIKEDEASSNPFTLTPFTGEPMEKGDISTDNKEPKE